MFRKFVCVFLIAWLVASPAYASTSSSALDWQVAPMSVNDGIMTAASDDYSSASIAGTVYDVESGSFSITAYNSILSGTVTDKLGACYFKQNNMGFNSASPFVGYAMKFDGMSSSSMGNTWSITLNHLMLFYRTAYNGTNIYLNINPAFTAPAQAVAVCNWSGSGYLPSSSGGSGSWATLSGSVRLPVNVSASDVALQELSSFSPRYSGNVNMQVTFDLPDTVTEDGYTYEVRSGSVKSMYIYVVYPFRPSNLFDYNGIPITDNYPGFDTNGLAITDFSRLLYANGEPAMTITVSSAEQSTNGLSQSIGNIGQSISQLQQNVTKQITDVKRSIQQGAAEVKNEISNQTQTLTDKLTNVKDGIVEGITGLKETTEQGFKDVVQGITDLPGKIKEMLTEFIVPDEETVAGKMTDFQSLAEEKLGVIYQVPTMLFDMAEGIVSGVTNPQGEMVLPKFEIIMPATNQTRSVETLTVWEEYRFPIWPAGTEVIQTAVQTATSMICVIFTFNALKRKYEEWLDGH